MREAGRATRSPKQALRVTGVCAPATLASFLKLQTYAKSLEAAPPPESQYIHVESGAEGHSGNNTRSGARSGWLPILVQSLMSLNLCATQFSLSKAESVGPQLF